MADWIALTAPFWGVAVEAPDRSALWVDGEIVTYGELAERSARIGGWVRSVGAGESVRVGVLADRGAEAIAAILGVVGAGATYVPLNPAHPPARIAQLLERADLHAIVMDASSAALVASMEDSALPAHRLVLGGAGLANCPLLPEPVAVSGEALAYVMFTSGTTGEPKGVMVQSGAVQHYLDTIARRYSIGAGDRASQFFELTFDLSVHDIFAVLNAGAQLFVVPSEARFAPLRFAVEHRLTIWFSVPSTVAFLARVNGLRPGSLADLRLSLFCGEALPEDSARQWCEVAPASVVDNLYGPTEATVACLVQRCESSMPVTVERGCVAIGRPFDGMLAGVVDGEGRFVEGGATGELALAGPQLASGYWRDPELTAQRFPILEHPLHGKRRWYLTGDLAREDGGIFHHLGRVDHQVQVRGHRVELEEVEAHLRSAAGCQAAGAVAWPVQAGIAQGIVAFVSGARRTPIELRNCLLAALPAYMVPRRVIELDTLPTTLHGKLDRRALIAWLESELCEQAG